MDLRATLDAWTLGNGDASSEATRLESHLNRKGFQAHHMKSYEKMAGLSIVFVGRVDEVPTLVLVAPGDLVAVTDAVWKYSHLPIMKEHIRGLASNVSSPTIDQVIWSGLAEVEVELAQIGMNWSLSIDDVDGVVAKAIPILRKHLRLGLDLQDTPALLDEIDAWALRHRPYAPEDFPTRGTVWPVFTLLALGLVANQAARTELGNRSFEWGCIGLDGSWKPIRRVVEAEGFPATKVDQRAFSLCKRIGKRWDLGSNQGTHSLASMWGGVSGGIRGIGEASEETVTALRIGLGLAGRHLALMACNLDEDTPCMPTTLALFGQEMRDGYIQAPDGGAAAGMFSRSLKGEFAQATCVAMVLDGLWMGKDALWATVAAPASGHQLQYVMPYVRNGGLQFPESPILLAEGLPIDQELADQLVLQQVGVLPDPVIQRLMAARGVKGTAKVRSDQEQAAGRLGLAGTAPIAMLQHLINTGSPADRIKSLWRTGVEKGTLNQSVRLTELSPMTVDEAFDALAAAPRLISSALIALGAHCKAHPVQSVVLDEMLGLLAAEQTSNPRGIAEVELMLDTAFNGDLGDAPAGSRSASRLVLAATAMMVFGVKGRIDATDRATIDAVYASIDEPVLVGIRDRMPQPWANGMAAMQHTPEAAGHQLNAYGRVAPEGSPARAALLMAAQQIAVAIEVPQPMEVSAVMQHFLNGG